MTLTFGKWIALALVLLIAGVAGAEPLRSAPPNHRVSIVGASLLMPLMTDIARRFENENPSVKIELRLTGVGEALSLVRTGAADVALLQRDLQKGERELFGHPIARDGVAVVVHGANPVKNISSKELTAIVTGRIQNWGALGGRDEPIKLGWLAGEGLSYFMLEYLKIRPDQIGPHTLVRDNEAALRFVASDRNAIALASVAVVEHGIRSGSAVRMLSFDSFAASNRTIQNHTYPLARPMLLVTRAVPLGRHKQFIDYAGSPHVLDLQLKHGFVPYEDSRWARDTKPGR